jgi:hypothetical protein
MKGTITAEIECRVFESRERNNHAITVESTAIRRAPVASENDSRNDFIGGTRILEVISQIHLSPSRLASYANKSESGAWT